jgi:hypothetical protein
MEARSRKPFHRFLHSLAARSVGMTGEGLLRPLRTGEGLLRPLGRAEWGGSFRLKRRRNEQGVIPSEAIGRIEESMGRVGESSILSRAGGW